MIRYAPHAIVVILLLILPLAVSIFLFASAMALYTAYVWYAFQLFAVGVSLSIREAFGLALVDVANLFSFDV